MKKKFISEDFRRSMGWLHTWAGITLSALLFAIFWMGTLSVFDSEIDKWMKPELRILASETRLSIDQDILPAIKRVAPAVTRISLSPPDARQTIWKARVRTADGERMTLYLHPKTAEFIVPTDSRAGTGFFFPFHFKLHIEWKRMGLWIVGFAAIAMLVITVSGIFIHRKIFAEFFTFRPKKQLRRSTLDLHNLTAIVALPFHILMPLSGLVIFFAIYLPWAVGAPYGGERQHIYQDIYGSLRIEKTKSPRVGALVSIDRLVETAEANWTAVQGQPEHADSIQLANLDDGSAYIRVRQLFPSRRVTASRQSMMFAATTGEVLSDFQAKPIRVAESWLRGFHFIQFNHWPLRWLYFLGGLAGCGMIATGQLFWMRSRIRKNHKEPLSVRTVRALTVGSVTGIMVATLAFLVANRLLPETITYAGRDRSDLEVWVFFTVWFVTFLHGALRNKSAWRDQLIGIAALAILSVILNAVTTGDTLWRAATDGNWVIFGMDCVLIFGAIIAGKSARRLGRVTEGEDRQKRLNRDRAQSSTALDALR